MHIRTDPVDAMSSPAISVVMPVWNGEKHLAEAIESILAQTFTNFEFIIVDDGSTDSTPRLLTGFAEKDNRIRIINLPHEGIVAALNRGVAEAQAQWIARMDSDDVAYPDRLARQWAAIHTNPAVILCHTQIRIIGDPKYVTKSARLVKTRGMIALRLCYMGPIVHPTVMYRKDAFFSCGRYHPEERHAEDFGLWGRMVELGEVIGIRRPLLDFRVHENSISKVKLEAQQFVSREIAVRHCAEFMLLEPEEAERAYRALRYQAYRSSLWDWFWLIFRCLPRLKWRSAEVLMWAARQSIRRIYFAIISSGL